MYKTNQQFICLPNVVDDIGYCLSWREGYEKVLTFRKATNDWAWLTEQQLDTQVELVRLQASQQGHELQIETKNLVVKLCNDETCKCNMPCKLHIMSFGEMPTCPLSLVCGYMADGYGYLQFLRIPPECKGKIVFKIVRH